MPKTTREPVRIYTIGHSNHSIEDFLEMLEAFDARLLVDVRTIPRSRNNPQFNSVGLKLELENEGIAYLHMKELGGLRKAKADSVNTGWRNLSFRGYADYMQTEAFTEAVERLIDEARKRQAAVMCAESVPWRCHRSLIADALTVRGVAVEHIMSESKLQRHTITGFARMEGTKITYPS